MSLSLDPRTTALVLIDLQQGVLSMPLSPYAHRRSSSVPCASAGGSGMRAGLWCW